MITSITKEGLKKMNFLFGKSKSFGNIDLNSLKRLYFESITRYKGFYWGLAAVYEMGRIDGIRQERERRKTVQDEYKIADNTRAEHKTLHKKLIVKT
ncbi:hypothetical protein [Clostridium sp. BNL1100]|uniref:hypothetical protein n=1 Tax=Clostridium sp. BNL1100 TaxID=755731 RepID=UPI00024A729F|nr:hypothetical protein [Clostridium sp. BNL1100]AEY66344.1 hypothetical protein Clo1100_2160 [Clostridium sp. BNL1100]